MRQLLSSVEFSLSPDTAVGAMVSVRNEVQERSLACRKIDDEEVQLQVAILCANRSSISSLLRLLARCERSTAA